MKIELRKIADIFPYENNPRLNDAAVDAVARSIQEFGFRQPVVVTRWCDCLRPHALEGREKARARKGPCPCGYRTNARADPCLQNRRQ